MPLTTEDSAFFHFVHIILETLTYRVKLLTDISFHGSSGVSISAEETLNWMELWHFVINT